LNYYRSADFRHLDSRTQQVRRLILDGLCKRGAGPLPYNKLTPLSILKWRDAKADRPEAANALIKALRQLYTFAIEYRYAARNPAKDVKYLKGNPDGFHSWTEEEIRRFEVCHHVGSKARLALALLLYTGQRRSDIVLFGRQHVRGEWLHFTQQKNRARKPITLTLPIHPALQRIIEATPSGTLTFLVTEFGRPFTANGFGNRFRKWCDEADLPAECSAHGLRKAAATRLAEAGASELEIRAITGHQTSREVSRYTKAASQKVLAKSGMEKLTGNKIVPLEPAISVPPKKVEGNSI
jgi:integrase